MSSAAFDRAASSCQARRVAVVSGSVNVFGGGLLVRRRLPHLLALCRSASSIPPALFWSEHDAGRARGRLARFGIGAARRRPPPRRSRPATAARGWSPLRARAARLVHDQRAARPRPCPRPRLAVEPPRIRRPDRVSASSTALSWRACRVRRPAMAAKPRSEASRSWASRRARLGDRDRLYAMWLLPHRAIDARELLPAPCSSQRATWWCRSSAHLLLRAGLGRSEETYGAFGAAATSSSGSTHRPPATGAAFLNATLWKRRHAEIA